MDVMKSENTLYSELNIKNSVFRDVNRLVSYWRVMQPPRAAGFKGEGGGGGGENENFTKNCCS